MHYPKKPRSKWMPSEIKQIKNKFDNQYFHTVLGVDAYRTIQLIAEQDYPVATAYAVSTVTKACLIAFGIMTVSAIFRKIRTKKYKLTP